MYDTMEEFNVDWKAEQSQWRLNHSISVIIFQITDFKLRITIFSSRPQSENIIAILPITL